MTSKRRSATTSPGSWRHIDGDGWQGPLTTSYGLHLVRITHRGEPTRATLADARDVVAREWSRAQTAKLKAAVLPDAGAALHGPRRAGRQRRTDGTEVGRHCAAPMDDRGRADADVGGHDSRRRVPPRLPRASSDGRRDVRRDVEGAGAGRYAASGHSRRLSGRHRQSLRAARTVSRATASSNDGPFDVRAASPTATVRIDGLPGTITDVLARVEREDGTTQVARLLPEQPAFVVEPSAHAAGVAWTYLGLGVHHILVGIDHLLYILAMLFLVKGWRRIVATMTAFTMTHSLTLTAAALGWVHVPQPPVEACIALSIVFVAREIVQARRGQPGLTARWPWVVSFSFGLMHGFGFAGALAQVGLPARAIPVALLFFNVGVEIGQLVFVDRGTRAVLLAGEDSEGRGHAGRKPCPRTRLVRSRCSGSSSASRHSAENAHPARRDGSGRRRDGHGARRTSVQSRHAPVGFIARRTRGVDARTCRRSSVGCTGTHMLVHASGRSESCSARTGCGAGALPHGRCHRARLRGYRDRALRPGPVAHGAISRRHDRVVPQDLAGCRASTELTLPGGRVTGSSVVSDDALEKRRQLLEVNGLDKMVREAGVGRAVAIAFLAVAGYGNQGRTPGTALGRSAGARPVRIRP